MSGCEICLPIACSHCEELNCPDRLCPGLETKAGTLLRKMEDMSETIEGEFCCSDAEARGYKQERLDFATLIAEVQAEAIAGVKK